MTDADQLARDLRVSVGLLLRRMRQVPTADELTMPETAVLARLDRGGPLTSAELARAEQISPQSMGVTVGGLVDRGLVTRAADPGDGRRSVLTISDAGLEQLWQRRNARIEALAQALATEFTDRERAELATAAPLLERLAQSI
jgi:DNA-binding MarR family transcriptional regulator